MPPSKYERNDSFSSPKRRGVARTTGVMLSRSDVRTLVPTRLDSPSTPQRGVLATLSSQQRAILQTRRRSIPKPMIDIASPVKLSDRIMAFQLAHSAVDEIASVPELDKTPRMPLHETSDQRSRSVAGTVESPNKNKKSSFVMQAKPTTGRNSSPPRKPRRHSTDEDKKLGEYFKELKLEDRLKAAKAQSKTRRRRGVERTYTDDSLSAPAA